MNHLLFEYIFGKRIWGSVMNFYLISNSKIEWDDLVARELAHVKGKSLTVSVFKLAWWFLLT